MDDVEILYQTYLVTFATAAALLRSRDASRLAFLLRDVNSREGLQRFASELALSDARELGGEIRTRQEVLQEVVARTAAAFGCDPDFVYAALARHQH